MKSRLARLATHTIALVAVSVFADPLLVNAGEESRYVDRNFGFSFSMPRFAPSTEKGVATVAVALAGPPIDSFASNLNVVVENLDTTLEAYQERHAEELRSVGWEVVEQSRREINGTPALRTHARASLNGLAVESLAVAMIGTDKRVYTLTCTSSTSQFPLYQMEFDRVVSSFSLGR